MNFSNLIHFDMPYFSDENSSIKPLYLQILPTLLHVRRFCPITTQQRCGSRRPVSLLTNDPAALLHSIAVFFPVSSIFSPSFGPILAASPILTNYKFVSCHQRWTYLLPLFPLLYLCQHKSALSLPYCRPAIPCRNPQTCFNLPAS